MYRLVRRGMVVSGWGVKVAQRRWVKMARYFDRMTANLGIGIVLGITYWEDSKILLNFYKFDQNLTKI